MPTGICSASHCASDSANPGRTGTGRALAGSRRRRAGSSNSTPHGRARAQQPPLRGLDEVRVLGGHRRRAQLAPLLRRRLRAVGLAQEAAQGSGHRTTSAGAAYPICSSGGSAARPVEHDPRGVRRQPPPPPPRRRPGPCRRRSRRPAIRTRTMPSPSTPVSSIPTPCAAEPPPRRRPARAAAASRARTGCRSCSASRPADQRVRRHPAHAASPPARGVERSP